MIASGKRTHMQNLVQVRGQKIPQNSPNLAQIGFSQPNPQSRKLVSVVDEAICVKFDRQIENGERYPKSVKFAQKVHMGVTWPTIGILGPPNVSETVEATKFKFGIETDGSEY